MIFTDEVSGAIEEIARENSAGRDIDPHWEGILPEVIGLFRNEIFLAKHRSYIDERMIQRACKLAQMTISRRNTKELDIATLALHYWTSKTLSGISKDRNFQVLVDQMNWVNPSLIWLPACGIDEQVFDAMVDHYERRFFAERCYDELISRGRKSEYLKCTHVLLNNSDQFRPQQEVARKWLREKSGIIAAGVGVDSGVGEDLLHNFLAKLLDLPWHVQIQRAGATYKAIHDGADDMRRKGGRYKHVSLDDEHNDSIQDESARDPIERMIDDESPKRISRILECQPQIEKILSGGRAKLGKRRFQVLRQMRTDALQKENAALQKEIAKQLNISESTITRDIEVIRKSWGQIEKLLEN